MCGLNGKPQEGCESRGALGTTWVLKTLLLFSLWLFPGEQHSVRYAASTRLDHGSHSCRVHKPPAFVGMTGWGWGSSLGFRLKIPPGLLAWFAYPHPRNCTMECGEKFSQKGRVLLLEKRQRYHPSKQSEGCP